MRVDTEISNVPSIVITGSLKLNTNYNLHCSFPDNQNLCISADDSGQVLALYQQLPRDGMKALLAAPGPR